MTSLNFVDTHQMVRPWATDHVDMAISEFWPHAYCMVNFFFQLASVFHATRCVHAQVACAIVARDDIYDSIVARMLSLRLGLGL